jgi:rSAM/selenodomain-associated transferase 2
MRRGPIDRTEGTTGEIPPLFSVIVPVFRERGEIVPCLQRLEQLRRIAEFEVIVVDGDGGSTISHLEASHLEARYEGLRLSTVITPPGRGVQLNRGAEIARGEYLVFLHVDTRLPVNALTLIERTLECYEAGVFRLRIDTEHPFLLLGNVLANLRARVLKLPYGDQTYFIRRTLFQEVGGFRPIPIMEDVALMAALKRRRVRLGFLPERSVTSSRRWEREGVYRGTFRNWTIALLYRLGVSPERLARAYRPHME